MSDEDLPIRVLPVDSPALMRRFIDLPWSIYRDDPHWVPPLKSDVRKAFDPAHHPFHQHSEAQPFLALRGERPVGRIAAIRNRNHEAFHGESVGFFGWFECVEDPAVSAALFDRAAEWVRQRGLSALRGPTSFSTNEVTGFLLGGEPGPPVLMMPHNPPYYLTLAERYGFGKAKDLNAFMIDDQTPPEHLLRAERIVTRRSGVRLRTLEMARFEEELATVRRLYNAAWEKNWGFVPMTDAEFDYLAAELKPILDPRLALFVETPDGETVGFALALPDYNQVLRHLNGRLLPFGILKALWYRRRIHRMRVLTLGLLEEYRGKGIDALLYLGLIRNGAARGITECEQSWILEDNEKMNAAIERLGGRLYRRYRLYERPL